MSRTTSPTGRAAPRKRTTAEAAHPRAAILAAALRILGSDDHSALTVRRVAAEAGCSTIGVYTWFGGKAGLVDAILIDGFESFATALQSARRKRGPFGTLMAQGFAYRAWALANPTHYQVMFMQAVPGHVPGEAANAAGRVAFETLRAEVERLHDAGVIAHQETDAVAMAIWGTVHGLAAIEIAHVEPQAHAHDASLHQRSFNLAMTLLSDSLTAGPRSDNDEPRTPVAEIGHEHSPDE